jgi:hypothetical protein
MVKVAGSNPASRSTGSRSTMTWGGDPVDGVLVINAGLGPLHRVSLRYAIRTLCRQVAVVHEAEPDRLLGLYPLSRVVRLVRTW